MAFTSAKMGLRIWNLLTDLYDHTQLADNWAKVDYHDHSAGKGVQIPTEGIADAAITGAKLASAIDPTGAYTTIKTLRVGMVNIASGSGSGNAWALAENLPNQFENTSATSVWYFDPADYAVAGRTTKLVLRSTAIVNGAGTPGVNYTVSIKPVSSISAGTTTLGSSLTGSSITFTAPAANSMSVATTGDFDPPAAGFYIFSAALSGTSAATVALRVHLGVHQI